MEKILPPICSKLMGLKDKKRIPFHMPGHKRRWPADDLLPGMRDYEKALGDVYGLDITEITGYDDLHNPRGIIRESMDCLREICHTVSSWYLVNGSTAGVLASISAVCRPGDRILVARNCHRSVYHALRLLRLDPVYLYPEYCRRGELIKGIGEGDRAQLNTLLKRYPDIKAMVITSPTYEGLVSDVRTVKEIIRPYGIPLIVDEAHGAHFIYHEAFPESALECGADLVVQSVHKTLPCATQTALLHLCSDLVPEERVREMLSVYQTSSPSYLLLASAEYGVFYAHNHPEKMGEYVDKLLDFRKKCEQLKRIRLFSPEPSEAFAYDPGKLLFLTRGAGLDGLSFFRILLDRYHIECEMACASSCLAMTSLSDRGEDLKKLEEAVFAIDGEPDSSLSDRSSGSESGNLPNPAIFSLRPEKKTDIWEAMDGEKISLDWNECPGRTAADYVCLYPPGIPILVPGEKITKEIVEKMNEYLYNGYNVPALSDGQFKVTV